jgi:tRNA nucleotidyltransferase (CCA-adding enzyme)
VEKIDPVRKQAEVLQAAIPTEIRELSAALRAKGFRAWAVGGSVRDILAAAMRGETRSFHGDWDVATDALPLDVKSTFRKVIPTGIEHGTVTVLLGERAIEVTTLRGERGHTDGRRPDEVFFVNDLKEDLARRDFTVNAIAFDIEASEIIDPFGGRADIESRVLRAVGNAEERYNEDGLRSLRGARFAAQLEMDLEKTTREAIRPTLETFRRVSKERVRDEWLKALKTRRPSQFLKILMGEGLLLATLPDLFSEAGPDKVEAMMVCLDRTTPDPVRRLAHFLSAGISTSLPLEGRARVAEDCAMTLRLSNKDRERIVRLIRAEATPDAEPPAIRRYLSRVGREHADDVLTYLSERNTPDTLLLRMRMALQSEAPLSTRELAITGRDLLEAGLSQGPKMKVVFEDLMNLVLDSPEANHKESLLARARAISGLTDKMD